MKFDHAGTEVQSQGDIKANKVSIDIANVDFIITILSTNLYSNPIQSFLRETVSNGWDSHVEAGIDEPVIIELGTDSEGQDYCKIQDFGVGLSPERFNDIYRNIGSSTKRSDNSQIGGFGIGRFSALAYTDMVNITSVYNGKEYQYVMYKDGNSISIDLLLETNTDNRNGVTVKVDIAKSDVNSFIQSIRAQLPYFENLYVDCTYLDSPNIETYKNSIDDFNNSVIKRYPSFNVSSMLPGAGMKILLGKVLYPLRTQNLKSGFPARIFSYPIALRFDIGELEVTPNREEILYTDKNVEVIERKVDEANTFIEDLIIKESNKDFNNIPDYLNAISSSITISLLKNGDVSLVKFTTPPLGVTTGATLNGVSYNKENFIGIHNNIMNATLLNLSFMSDYGRLIQGKNVAMNKLSLTLVKQKFQDTYFCGLSDINNYTKSWIRETFADQSKFILPIRDGKSLLLKYMRYVISQSANKYSHLKYNYDPKIFKIIARYCIKNLQKLQVITDNSVPQSFIDKKKADMRAARALAQKSVVDWKQNMNLYPIRTSEVNFFRMVTDSELVSLEELKDKYKQQVVYAEKDNKTIRALASILYDVNQTKFIEVAPTKIKLLSHLQNFTKLEDFMSNPRYKGVSNLATAYKIQQEIPHLKELASIKNLGVISPELQDVVNNLYKYVKLYTSRIRTSEKIEKQVVEDICSVCEKNNWYNFNMLGLMKQYKKSLDRSAFLLPFISDTYAAGTHIPDKQIPTMIDYIMARKLFIPNRETLKKLRNPQTENNESNKA